MDQNTNLASKKEVEEFYNTFKAHQQKLGVNIRHRTIFKNLKKLGLKPDSNVLEIGCGIGTVSSLILKHIPKGNFTGVDISTESIAQAKKFNAQYANAEFIVNDMSSFNHRTKFDFVVLPDVLEHIPVDQHSNLFKTISEVTTPEVTVLINIPEPFTLDWVRRNKPEALQIIDQSLSIQDLANHIYPSGFYIFSISPYGLQYEHEEYLSIVLKKNFVRQEVHLKSKAKLGIENTISKIG
jgi:trans-aconitate 2-methyltransferase